MVDVPSNQNKPTILLLFSLIFTIFFLSFFVFSHDIPSEVIIQLLEKTLSNQNSEINLKM